MVNQKRAAVIGAVIGSSAILSAEYLIANGYLNGQD